jgi:hypothetical protein
VSNGVVAIPSNQAYGTWEFDLYKGTDESDLSVCLISDKNIPFGNGGNGYSIQFHDLESIMFRRITNGSTPLLFSSGSDYINNNTWYRIKITRSVAGVFTVYIKGGSFGDDYVLVSTTSGSGTNPVTHNTYTTSNFFVLYLDAGDRIANIAFKDYVE